MKINFPVIKRESAKKEGEKPEEVFSQLLAEFEYERPKQGQILEGEVLLIEENQILVDVGLKRDAVVTAKELSQTDASQVDSLSVGDTIPVCVTHPGKGNEDLLISLRKASAYKNWQQAEQYLAVDTVLELTVTDVNRGGLLVRFEQLEGFIPNSHIPGLPRGVSNENKQSIKREWVGKTIPVTALEVDRAERRLIFSGLAADQDRRKDRLLALTQKKGDEVEGVVSSVVSFGVFVDLGGVDGLVHISELDWKHVEDPTALFEAGDAIAVEVLDVDIARERVTLSRKNLLPNPWEKIAAEYQPGDLIQVEVIKVMDFGAFALLPHGVHGLIPRSEMGYAPGDIPVEDLTPGDKVLAKILSLDVLAGEMALSMQQVPREKQLDWLLRLEPSEAKMPEEGAVETRHAVLHEGEDEPSPVPADSDIKEGYRA